MTIENKFEINDIVYFMEDNKIKTSRVEEVNINLTKPLITNDPCRTIITYVIGVGACDSRRTETKNEENLFGSVDELLEHLKKGFERT